MASITKRNNAYWVRYDTEENGERKQRSKTFEKYSDAVSFRKQLEQAIADGSYTESNDTLKKYMDDYFSLYCANLGTNTLVSYKKYMEKHIYPHIGNVLLEKLTAVHIQKVYNSLDVSAKTLRNIHGVLSKALKQAVFLRLIQHNPCQGVVLPKVQEFEPKIPEEEQLQNLIEHMKASRFYEAMLCDAMLGVRRGEVLGLYWSDIDFAREAITIRRSLIYDEESHCLRVKEPKTRASCRELSMPEGLASILKPMREIEKEIKSPFVFTNSDGTPIRPTALSKEFHDVAVSAGLDGMRLHDLRHTVVTYLLRAGISPKAVQAHIGHTDARFTLNRYAHVLDADKKESAATMNKILHIH